MKYGVALEGGGSKGAYHVGALKAIEEEGIELSGVTGTSIGSINGAYYVQEGIEKMYEFWENIKPEHLIPDNLNVFRKSLETGQVDDYRKLMKEFRESFAAGGLDLTNFKKTLYDHIDEEKIRARGMDFGLVTVSLTDMRSIEIMLDEIPEGKLIEFLIASSYLPGFKREKLSGKSFIDGAFHDNLPVNLLIDNGYKNIIAIELLGRGLKQKVKDKSANITYIRPSDDTGGTIEFRKEIIERNLKMGYYDALRALRGYYGQWYYITDIWSPEETYQMLDKFSKEEVESLASILNIKMIPYKRCLFEKIVPKLMDLLDIPDYADYNMIELYILEYVAKLLDIDRYQLLTMDELASQIMKKISSFENHHRDWGDSFIKFLKSLGLYTHTFKDQVLIGCVKVIASSERGGFHGL
ncbi:patatin-like phospholipase family protein [Acidaminobacter sp. JC074]|uniref:patatin-like phospholipase family protein n=1 Tax=Acidaminobacter sp. JC074 TaxID=2530199 RepID=UPI001F0CF137|nr:patatin-like phospholipase family protein [Acidaminobacter sp. JC074]MCH4889320.1 patatin-like phospholipase family protein [Acidaminobacter sp. JC074]